MPPNLFLATLLQLLQQHPNTITVKGNSANARAIADAVKDHADIKFIERSGPNVRCSVKGAVSGG